MEFFIDVGEVCTGEKVLAAMCSQRDRHKEPPSPPLSHSQPAVTASTHLGMSDPCLPKRQNTEFLCHRAEDSIRE